MRERERMGIALREDVVVLQEETCTHWNCSNLMRALESGLALAIIYQGMREEGGVLSLYACLVPRFPVFIVLGARRAKSKFSAILLQGKRTIDDPTSV